MADHFSEYDAFNVPPEFKPIGAFGYIGYSILFSIPILGFIFLIVFSFSDANINRRNFARSYLVGFVVLVVLIVVGALTGVLAETFRALADGQLPPYLSFLPFYHHAA